MGTCSALTGVAAAACYNTGHTTAGYALTGVSGAAGSAAAFTALHNKKPASSNDVELGSHNSDAASHHSDAASHHSDAASHHSGSSGASFHTANSHKRSTEEVMEEFE
jgi:hypothetical protein